MSTEPSKFAENQFEAATRESNPLMGEALDSTVPRITVAAVTTPALAPARDAVLEVAALWSDLEITAASARAGQLSATQSFADYMASLTREPDADTNSPLETWDAAIRSEVAFGEPSEDVIYGDARATDARFHRPLAQLDGDPVRVIHTQEIPNRRVYQRSSPTSATARWDVIPPIISLPDFSRRKSFRT